MLLKWESNFYIPFMMENLYVFIYSKAEGERQEKV